mmetsp:Transcript_18940/g.26566  ORF Transcript_18940/g.26566 Transcript_18940/m.26566 type:complete len:127 (+) Transcript_18940:35-415(+)|eukprot:CAMPEP_0175097368 /NCGR_PEP_ID=MMETSP0086_2-20121207/5249_1 /TAXON_ID=136419 /ORGANISM="Unknown Unknown, Strain D1" /LENGTH=126 /DNA_ID=CAMNT_0016370873 /DNA_START=35 /DNA_END=415 /DNA_ORIENTATION=+
MVIKTDTCYYTEMKVYPGWGIRVVRKDGKLLTFLNAKAKSLFMQGIKSQRLTWTQAWRRRNKKGQVTQGAKKRTKRAAKTYKAIQGLSIEDLRKKRTQKPEFRAAQRAAALREVKDRNKKKPNTKK